MARHTRRRYLTGAAGLFAVSTVAGCLQRGGSSDGHEMIMGHATGDDAQDECAELFCDEVEALTDGQISAQNHPNNTLGNNEQMNEDVMQGVQHAIIQPSGFATGFAPALGVLDLPFLFPAQGTDSDPTGDFALQHDVLNSEAAEPLNEGLRENGLEPVAWFSGGYKQLVTTFGVEAVEDLEDRQFRAVPSPELIAQFEAIGATAVGMDLGELYSALEQGTVDGFENPPDVTRGLALQEVTEQMTLTYHGALSTNISVSQEWLESLPEDLQDAVITAGENVAEEAQEIYTEFQSTDLEALRDADGFEITTLPEDEQSTLEEMARDAWEEIEDDEEKMAALEELEPAIEDET